MAGCATAACGSVAAGVCGGALARRDPSSVSDVCLPTVEDEFTAVNLERGDGTTDSDIDAPCAVEQICAAASIRRVGQSSATMTLSSFHVLRRPVINL